MDSPIFSAKRRAEVVATRRLLVERFPKCFRAAGAPKAPLSRVIYDEVRQALPDIRARLLRDALHDYLTGQSYLRALVEGAPRFDLDGWPVSFVSEVEARSARRQLRDLHARFSSKEQTDAARHVA